MGGFLTVHVDEGSALLPTSVNRGIFKCTLFVLGLQFIFRQVVCFLQTWNLLILAIGTFQTITSASFLLPLQNFGVLKSDVKLLFLQKYDSMITPVKLGLQENNWEFTHTNKWHMEFYNHRLLCVLTVYLWELKL